jgi:hypothetical protein
MRGLGWYRARLRAMPPREVAYRVGQRGREWARRRRAGQPLANAEAIRAARPTGPLVPHPVAFFDVRFEYPGPEPIDWSRDYSGGTRAPRAFYADLDYRDAGQVGDSKYTWELSRHQFIVPWALAYAETKDEAHADAAVALVLDWIEANPAYVGINWMSALELALRILSWGIAFDLCAAAPSVRGARAVIGQAVAAQADFIRESLSRHSSANNHLMGEQIGLLAAGVFFPEAAGARAHAEWARGAIVEEAVRQNHSDGVNREQATYYHHYVAEYVLTALALFARAGWEQPPHVRDLARRMIDLVDAVTDDRGEAFEVGDRDEGTATGLNLGTGIGVYESLLRSGWRVFGEARWGAHAARIARANGRAPGDDPRNDYWYPDAPAEPEDAPARRRYAFAEGGQLVSHDDGLTLFFRAGPFGYPAIAAHAHCDQLAVGLKAGEHTILADAGTFVYHDQDRWRRYFKGTTAHNTVRVDGADQAEYAGPFLWATHADGRLTVERDTDDELVVRGAHDGYLRLADPVRHERRIEWRTGLGYRVVDRLTGAGAAHVFELVWNLAPGLEPEPLQSGGLACAFRVPLPDGRRLAVLVQAEPGAEAAFHRGDEDLPAGFHSPRYGEREPAWQVRLTVRATAGRFVTCLVPHAAGEDPARVAARW